MSNPPISQSSNPAIRQKRGRRQSEWSMSIHFYFLFFSRYIVASFCSLADVPSVRLLRLHFVCGKATQRNTKFGFHGSTCVDDLTKLVPSILMLRKLKASSLHYSGSNFIMRQKGYHSVSTTPNIWKSPTDLLARCEKHWSRAWRPLQITHLTIPNVRCKEKIFR